MGADALVFKWVTSLNSLLTTIIKITELVMGALLSLVIVPVIGLFLGTGGLI